jgi:4-hydroxybenzoate polyprenyltransferase
MSPEPQSQAKVASALHSAWTAIRALRLHYWLKNLLLFVPAIFAHALNPSIFSTLCTAFVAFGCVASAHYLMNDLLDREHDRQDSAKRQRPQAAGQLSSRTAAGLATVLISAAAIFASLLPAYFWLTLSAYLFICLAYSLLLKRVPLIDVLALTILLDLRLAAGASAIMTPLPNILLLACSCFFFALAVVKRIAQLSAPKDSLGRLSGRPYSRENLPALRVLAGVASVASILALAILLRDIGTKVARPGILWFFPLLQMTWLGRCFFLANDGKLNEDLVSFAITDVYSYIVLSVLALLLIAAG